MDPVALRAETSQPSETGRMIRVGSELYSDIVAFLYQEAALLDDLKIEEWSRLLAEDLVYVAPLRSTRGGPDRDKSVVHSMFHFEEDYRSIQGRIGRLGTKSAWAEDPPSRTRRNIGNILAYETPRPDEIAVRSNFLLVRSRYESSDFSFMSGVRHDLLRRKAGAFYLARREIILDQAVLGMANLAVFL